MSEIPETDSEKIDHLRDQIDLLIGLSITVYSSLTQLRSGVQLDGKPYETLIANQNDISEKLNQLIAKMNWGQ